MVKAVDLVDLRRSSDTWEQTERLKAQFAGLRLERRPLFLTAAEFDDILRWKLRQQYGRQLGHRAANTDELIQTITGIALTVTHEDKEYELELRVMTLCALRGVSVPVASAVLALVFPDEYAVIDYRAWRQIFNEERRTFSVPDYKRYMTEMRRLAQELSWPVQEVDLAVWEYDRRHRPSMDKGRPGRPPERHVEAPSKDGLTQCETVTSKPFYYDGTVSGSLIVYPTDTNEIELSGTAIRIPAHLVDFIRAEIRRAGSIGMGGSFSNPPPGSLGYRLREEGKPPVLSYVIPLLIEEGFCTAVADGRRYVIHHTARGPRSTAGGG